MVDSNFSVILCIPEASVIAEVLSGALGKLSLSQPCELMDVPKVWDLFA